MQLAILAHIMAKMFHQQSSAYSPEQFEGLVHLQATADILTVSVGEELPVIQTLSEKPLSANELSEKLKIPLNSTVFVVERLKELELVSVSDVGEISLSPLAKECLIPGEHFCVAEYFGLSGITAGAKQMLEMLREGSLTKSMGAMETVSPYTAAPTMRNTMGNAPELIFPRFDATPLFDVFRLKHIPDITVAFAELLKKKDPFKRGSATFREISGEMKIDARPLSVALTALYSLGLLKVEGAKIHKQFPKTFFTSLDAYDLASSQGVQDALYCMTNNQPVGGVQYVVGDDVQASPMHDTHVAKILTEALRGRAQHVAPYLAQVLDLSGVKLLRDYGCGSGIYSLELLKVNPNLRVQLVDTKEVLDVARGYVEGSDVADRVEFVAQDFRSMSFEEIGKSDAHFWGNIFHDYDAPEIQRLMKMHNADLPSGGLSIIHDAILNPSPYNSFAPSISSGSLEIAAYSWALFSITRGRAYNATEFQHMAESSGMRFVNRSVIPTHIQCSVMVGEKVH